MTALREGMGSFFSRAFNTSILEKNRLQWVDYLRGIAILLIVYRHVLVGIQRGNIVVPQFLIDANMVFYSFRMPLFFILSGLFISKAVKKHSLKSLLGNRFELLMYPYIVWAVIQITLQIALSAVTNSVRGFEDYLSIIYQPRSLDQFWFLPALFNTTLVYLLVKTKLKAPPGAQLILGLVLYFCSRFFQEVSMISDWMAFYFFFALGDVISQPFFKTKSQRFFNHPLSLVLIIPIFILAQRYYLANSLSVLALKNNTFLSRPDYLAHFRDQVDFLFIAIIGCISMFILAFRLQNAKILSFLRILGYHSLYIYVSHVIVTAFVRLSLIIVFESADPVIILCISIFLGIVVPIMFYNLLVKNGPLWFLFNYRRKKNKQEATPVSAPQVVIAAPAAMPLIKTVASNADHAENGNGA